MKHSPSKLGVLCLAVAQPKFVNWLDLKVIHSSWKNAPLRTKKIKLNSFLSLAEFLSRYFSDFNQISLLTDDSKPMN